MEQMWIRASFFKTVIQYVWFISIDNPNVFS